MHNLYSQVIQPWLFTCATLLAVICFIAAISGVLFLYAFRQHRWEIMQKNIIYIYLLFMHYIHSVVYFSQPRVNMLALVGCAVFALSPVLHGLDGRFFEAHTFSWLCLVCFVKICRYIFVSIPWYILRCVHTFWISVSLWHLDHFWAKFGQSIVFQRWNENGLSRFYMCVYCS